MTDMQLPDGWSWMRLGDVCQFIRGVTFDKADERGQSTIGFLPLLRAGNIKNILDIHDDLIWVPSKKISSEQLLQIGDIVICMSSGSSSVVGKTAQLKENFAGSVGAFCGILRPKVPHYSDYLSYWMRSDSFRKWRDNQARGANIQNLRFSQLEEILIPLPPLPEQQRIATILAEQMAAVEAARAAAQARLDAAESLAAAYLRAVFESEEAQGWETIQIKDIADVSGGIQKQPSRKPVNFHRPYLTVRNVQRGWLDLSQVEEFEITPDELPRYRLEHGDILIVEGNGSLDHIGRSAIFRNEIEDCIHQNHVIRVRVADTKAIPDFVSLYLNSEIGKAQMVDKARTSSGLYTLSVSKVNSLEVALPPVSTQAQILGTVNPQVEEVDRTCAAIQHQLDLINQLPSAILRRAFSGEL